MHSRNYLQPSPSDPSILRHQRLHPLESIWEGTIQEEVLTCRRHVDVLHLDAPPELIVPHLKKSGFIRVSRIRFFALDWHLISALVERWKPETHMFMLPIGECTITLEDIDIMTGLPIDDMGQAGQYSWGLACLTYLYRELCHGADPETKEISGAIFILRIWAWERIKSVAPSLPDPALHDNALLGSRWSNMR
ncbi:serine/threonine-protein phosphatase 7 long form homolog [Hevea brasiliensis]|uniref:serine/threonine-protein phosphatase 7 long form homolog n=1 Tax=Hevea brasiliensis TaxID=3981 RepID=UPI000B76FD0C|nr:serine/threonine-protein phosphatase 7 long form homolog [Hevea brasiliensis]